MNNDIRFIIRRVICYLLAFVMAGCIALSLSAGISSGLLRSQEFVQERMEQHNEVLLTEVNKAIERIVAPQTDLPTKAFTQSVGEGHIKTVLDQVSGNLVYGFKTDFSQSKYLYSYYRTGIINFCENNGVKISEDEITRNACLAVDAFNQVCGDESTNFVIPFQEAQSRDPLTAIVISIVAFALCVLLLEFLNFGGYFKFAYIGMSILSAGFIMTILPAFALLMNYSSLFHFTDVEAYNLGIAQSVDSVLQIIIWVGFVVLVVGAVFMKVVYNHFKNQTIAFQTEIDIDNKLRQEFMEEQMMFEQEQQIQRQSEIEVQVQARIAQAMTESQNDEDVQELVEEITEKVVEEKTEADSSTLSSEDMDEIDKEIIERKIRMELEQEYQRKIDELTKNKD